jgi:hypothetical protein
MPACCKPLTGGCPSCWLQIPVRAIVHDNVVIKPPNLEAAAAAAASSSTRWGAGTEDLLKSRSFGKSSGSKCAAPAAALLHAPAPPVPAPACLHGHPESAAAVDP